MWVSVLKIAKSLYYTRCGVTIVFYVLSRASMILDPKTCLKGKRSLAEIIKNPARPKSNLHLDKKKRWRYGSGCILAPRVHRLRPVSRKSCRS
jgi:hypothetical protein